MSYTGHDYDITVVYTPEDQEWSRRLIKEIDKRLHFKSYSICDNGSPKNSAVLLVVLPSHFSPEYLGKIDEFPIRHCRDLRSAFTVRQSFVSVPEILDGSDLYNFFELEDYKVRTFSETSYHLKVDGLVRDLVSKLESVKNRLPTTEVLNKNFRDTDDLAIFINAAPEDQQLADEWFDFLKKEGFNSVLPITINSEVSITPTRIWEDFQQKMLFCNAMIILYDTNTEESWLKAQLNYYQRWQNSCQQLKTLFVAKESTVDLSFFNKDYLRYVELYSFERNKNSLDCSEIIGCLKKLRSNLKQNDA